MTILDPQLEWKDLNLRMLVSKTNALATWLHSKNTYKIVFRSR